ncbi:MAG: cytochrome c family protein [Paracoccaceae bacterium]|nr:cytochrome c family protein [Paracoccaceae bacterium]
MFKTTNIIKAAGALLGAFLFFLLGNWASGALYTIAGSAHTAAEGTEVAMMTAAPGGLLDKADDAAAAAPAEPAVALVLGEGNAAAGEKVFGKCKACHKVDGKNATGPHLDGVVGRPVASVADFGYSDAFKAHGGEWTLEALDAYLTKPKDYIPGNKMSFAGLPKPEDRNNVITYLQSLGG